MDDKRKKTSSSRSGLDSCCDIPILDLEYCKKNKDKLSDVCSVQGELLDPWYQYKNVVPGFCS